MIDQWAKDWGITEAALIDLRMRMGVMPPGPGAHATALSEAAVQQQVRLEAGEKQVQLWRNNVGALQDESGRWVRYGLCNDSKQLNARFKSGDLIGIKRVLIEPSMVGTVIGRFVSREVKPGGWRYTGTEREQAQQRWADLINAWGGDARFVTERGTL